MSSPEYVSLLGWGEESVLPPGEFTNAVTYIFAIEGDRAKLQSLAEKYLSAPTGGAIQVEAFTSTLLLTWTDAAKLSSPAENIGWTPNREVMLSYPLIVRRGLETFLMMWPAMIFIDNARGMVTGRESWGWFKQIGQSTADPDAGLFTLDTLIFPVFNPATEGQTARLIEVKKGAAESSAPREESFLDSAAAAFSESAAFGKWLWKLLSHAVEDAELIRDVWKIGADLSVPVINLKQFRDVRDGKRACYQAITSSPVQMTAFHGAGFLWGDYTVDFTVCASHQFVNQLGVAANPVPVRAAAYLKYDFLAPDGETLWQAQ